MKSIRLSLIVYFLVLFAGALGAVSWFVYGNSTQMLRKSEASRRTLLETQYRQRVAEAESAHDHRLLGKAQTLARLSRWSREHIESLSPLGVLGAVLAPQGQLAAPVWLGETFHPPLAFFVYRTAPLEISVETAAEDVLPPGEDGLADEFYQINGTDGQPLERSESLGEHVLALPEGVLDSDPFKERFDEYQLRPGLRLRMVTLRVVPRHRPSLLPEPPRPPRWGPPGRFTILKGPPPPRRDRRGPGGFFGPGPVVYIQYAISTAQHDATLAGYRADLQNGLNQLAEESETTLADLGRRLLWIGLVTFAALGVGGFWLVRLGLAPLERLSEAVSRVSAKDFRLQVDDRRLPRELQPIAGRLKQTLDLLRRAFSREKQAAADISHELRTPLAALLTTLDVGLRKPRAAEEYRELLEECRAAGQQMNHIVERLLALARLDAGVDNLRARDVDAAQLAEECAVMVRPLAEARDLTLHVRRNGPVPLHTDPDKLREILTNLLHNAIQYNRPHGSIEVAVARHNGAVDLEVQDTGIGIAPETRDQIFERFYRADPSRHTDELHAGLGLAIVKGYLDLMGGSIVVDSTVGEGSTFRVRLPAGHLASGDRVPQ
jgi:heavy metal sensor kinase